MDSLVRIKSYAIARQMVLELYSRGKVSQLEAGRILKGVAQDLDIQNPMLL